MKQVICYWGDFHVEFNAGAATCGNYYLSVVLQETTAGSFPKVVTFIISKECLAVPAIHTSNAEVSLYPNPATTDVNLVFDGFNDIKNIAVYNVIGKMMSIYKVEGNSANLAVENLPEGVYFSRLINADGNVVQQSGLQNNKSFYPWATVKCS